MAARRLDDFRREREEAERREAGLGPLRMVPPRGAITRAKRVRTTEGGPPEPAEKKRLGERA